MRIERGLMVRTLDKGLILEGTLINEILFGQDYDTFRDSLDSNGMHLHVDFSRYRLCLTGIPKNVYEERFGKSLGDFLQVLDALKARLSNEFAARGIAFDVAVVKYDGTKRICCLMNVPTDSKEAETDAGAFVHRSIVEAYREVWGLDESEYALASALSDRLEGFDALHPGFKRARQLANLSYFLDGPCLMTEEAFQLAHSPLSIRAMSDGLAEIERALARVDLVSMDSAHGELFEEVRRSFSFRSLEYVLAGISRMVARYDEVFVGGIDQSRYDDLDARSHYGLKSVRDASLELLHECARSLSTPSAGVGQVTLEAVRYLRSRYAESFTESSLARCIGVSPNYLSRVFNEEVGESMPSYLTKVRLARAKLLLETTDDAIAAIGLSVGFNSASYFSRLFKRRFGVTPARYRAQRTGGAR